jgi:hypothetical protein
VNRAATIALALAVLVLFVPGIPFAARIAIILTLPYWLGPIFIYFTQKVPRVADIRPLEPEAAPRVVAELLDETVRALAPLGFGERARLIQPSPGGLTGFAQLFEHVGEGCVCTRLVVVRAAGASPIVASDALYFVTREAGPRRLVTTNSSAISPHPGNPAFDAAQFASVRDPARLWAVHAARARRTTVVRDGVPQLDSPTDYQRAREAEAKDHLASSGWWKLDRAADVLRPTPVGALALTFGRLFPLRTLARRRTAAEERRLLAELGA